MSNKTKPTKLPPVTPLAVQELLDHAAPGWYDRKSIAAALGRAKTSHLIRTIDAAAEAGLIEREYWSLPGNGRYMAVYATKHLLTLDALYNYEPEREF